MTWARKREDYTAALPTYITVRIIAGMNIKETFMIQDKLLQSEYTECSWP